MAKAKKKSVKDVEIEEIEKDFVEEVEEVEEDTDVVVSNDSDDEDYAELSLEDRVANIEKKSTIILVITIITCIFAFLAMIAGFVGNSGSSTTTSKDNSHETSEDGSYDTSAFKEIKAQDIASVSKGKTVAVWIGRQGCYYCSLFAPIASQVSKDNNLDIYYIDLTKIYDFSNYETSGSVSIADQEAYKLLTEISTDSENEDVMENFGQTPMTLVIKNNKVIGNVIGAVDDDSLVEFFQKEGILK